MSPPQVTEIAAAGDAPSASTTDVTTMRTIDRIGDKTLPDAGRIAQPCR